jgi:putative ABC transport system permease protein
MRLVPLARRNLLAEPRRLAAGVAGIGLALALILLLGGLWAGIQAQSVQYVDAAGAALWALPPGTRTLFAEGTELPTSTLATVRATPGVDWAAPAWGLFAILDLHDTKAATVLIGSTPGQSGGAWALARGRAPTADDEVAVDRVLAGKHGLGLGDRLAVADRSYRVVGITRHAGFMTGYVFATHRAVETLLGAPGKTNAILVGTGQPAAVRTRLAARGLTVLDAPRAAPHGGGAQHQGVRVAATADGGDRVCRRRVDRGADRLRPGGRAPPRVRHL